MHNHSIKKYILLLYSFTLCGSSEPIKKTAAPKNILAVGPTLSWWRCPKQIILDAGNNKDFIKNNQSATVPGLFFSFKRKLWQSKGPLNFYIGLKTHYAKKKNGLKTDYFDQGTTQASLEIHQNIQSIQIAPLFEWLLNYKKASLSAYIAPTIGLKTIDQFRWWEKSTKSYTGQSLKPYNNGAFGEFGATLLFKSNKNRFFSFGYSFLIGRTTFKKHVIITTPDPNASQIFHDQLLLSDVNTIYLPVEPKIRYNAHIVHLGLAITF